MGASGVIGIRRLPAMGRMIMLTIVNTTQRYMLDSMQRPQLVEHRPDHHPKHEQRQKTGAQDRWDFVGRSEHFIRVRHAQGGDNRQASWALFELVAHRGDSSEKFVLYIDIRAE